MAASPINVAPSYVLRAALKTTVYLKPRSPLFPFFPNAGRERAGATERTEIHAAVVITPIGNYGSRINQFWGRGGTTRGTMWEGKNGATQQVNPRAGSAGV